VPVPQPACQLSVWFGVTSHDTPPSPLDDLPPSQHLPPEKVLLEMAEVGSRRASSMSTTQVLVLSILAGAFITAGALFSVLLSEGSTNPGTARLLEGFGFSTGFFLVILTGSLLFTEINVEMPATLLGGDTKALGAQVAKLWGLAAIGNMVGSFVMGWAMVEVSSFSPAFHEQLREIVAAKMRFREVGGSGGWAKAVLSGVIANWLVGIAAFLSVMGRSIIGKYIPVFLTVSLFVAGGFLHSPANMGYFSLAEHGGYGPGWGPAFGWSLAPAALGNILGAVFLVALPLWYAVTHSTEND